MIKEDSIDSTENQNEKQFHQKIQMSEKKRMKKP